MHPRKTGTVKGVTLHELKHVTDMRGDLIATELERDLPFVPRRVFFVHDVPSTRVRGEHAHRECQQFLVCLKGSVSVVVDDGEHSEEYELNHPWLGLHLPPRVWGIQYKYSADAVLMVYASHPYDPTDYIRDYDEFIREVRHA
ncbi:sugar 3,4-ketoisomerase [Lamprobacter sp.]|uniref:sugar 3,4-ketoisomerase n=1 Tax=Lamprobacter sp. TaxID=3100796 RepID=UPI003A4E186C